MRSGSTFPWFCLVIKQSPQYYAKSRMWIFVQSNLSTTATSYNGHLSTMATSYNGHLSTTATSPQWLPLHNGYLSTTATSYNGHLSTTATSPQWLPPTTVTSPQRLPPTTVTSPQRLPLHNGYLSTMATSLQWPPRYNGHFLLFPRWPLSRGSTVVSLTRNSNRLLTGNIKATCNQEMTFLLYFVLL